MKITTLPHLILLTGLFSVSAPFAGAQIISGSVGVSSTGTFANAGPSGYAYGLIDNNLTNGYESGFDLVDAPAALATAGPAGSAAFQWGIAATGTAYDHTSALWFQPVTTASVPLEQSFNLGYLYYRNGTIVGDSGAESIDLSIALSLTSGGNSLAMQNVNYHQLLVNSVNTDDPIASADIVSLSNVSAPLNFKDSNGRNYYLEMTFEVDQDTIDNSLSTTNEFRVFEGKSGAATLVGRLTTDPVAVPEPSGMVLSLLGLSYAGLRRRRKAGTQG